MNESFKKIEMPTATAWSILGNTAIEGVYALVNTQRSSWHVRLGSLDGTAFRGLAEKFESLTYNARVRAKLRGHSGYLKGFFPDGTMFVLRISRGCISEDSLVLWVQNVETVRMRLHMISTTVDAVLGR